MTYDPASAPFHPDVWTRFPKVAPIPGSTLGALWRVRLEGSARDGCAKVIPPDVGRSGPARRFVGERDALSRLPVRADLLRLVAHAEADDGTGLLVTGFVEGTNLRQWLREGGRPGTARAVAWTRRLLAALGAVHATGLVHCDVKPENVMRVGDGEGLVLVDFGLATPVGEPCVAIGGASAGTPRYMAPEQVRGAPVGAFTDTYAVAIVLYELLTGAPPFTGSASADVRSQQLQSRAVPPSVVAHDGEVSEALGEVVLKALEKKPESRFGTTAAFDAALAGLG